MARVVIPLGRMALRIRDRTFEISEASLMATLADPYGCNFDDDGRGKGLVWCLGVDVEPREIDGEYWQPSLQCGNLKIAVRDWRRIEGLRLAWDEPFDPESGEDNGSFCVFEHENVLRADIRFGSRRDARFSFECSGTCDIGWKEPYDADVPFEIVDEELRFDGIRVRGCERDAPEDLTRRLREYVSLDALASGKIVRHSARYEDGVGMCHQMFLPVF
jgi:hypothetical protein